MNDHAVTGSCSTAPPGRRPRLSLAADRRNRQRGQQARYACGGEGGQVAGQRIAGNPGSERRGRGAELVRGENPAKHQRRLRAAERLGAVSLTVGGSVAIQSSP